MNRNNFIAIYKSLVPTPLFFLLSIALPLGLRSYSIGRDWAQVITYSLYTLMFLGFIFSVKNAWTIQGKAKWIMMGVILILLPMQLILIAATEVGIFGK